MTTTIYYAQILKTDNKWYYVAMSGFFLTPEAALDCARIAAKNKRAKDFRQIQVEAELDADGFIAC